MDFSTFSTRISVWALPALLVGGLFTGMSVGVALSNYLQQTAASAFQDVPSHWNSAAKLPKKQSKSYAAAAAVVDPAYHYLRASDTLNLGSIALVSRFNHIPLERPEWRWSRSELATKHAPIERVYGHSKPTSKKPSAVIAALKNPEKRRLVVALDPGHGGTDPGSMAPNGLVEKELTLDMAKRVELFLSEIDNVDVIMTRSTDRGMSRQSRVNKIKAVNADVVVSLHFNHLPQTDINLVETFYADRHNIVESLEKQNRNASSVNLDFTHASRDLANILHRKVVNEVSNVNEDVLDAGVKADTLFVLTRSFTPGVLLELTCISNPAEAERLATPAYRNQLAASIADGLRDYLLDQHSDQFGELLAKLD